MTGAKADGPLPGHAAASRLLASARAEPPGVGEQIGGYELVEEVGRSAHAVVYRGRQHSPVLRDVAIKILYDPADAGNIRHRFLRERSLLARVSHHGLAQLLDCGETEPTAARAALPWFAMPFIEGEPIDRWCSRHRAPRRTRLRILELVADAIGAAHAEGVVHRDLKPSNVLVAGTPEDPRVVVIDFGIAKVLEDPLRGEGLEPTAHAEGATRQGAVVGTPEFMSPEQADLDGSRVGPASDVYAIGLVACLLLAGSVPGVERSADREAAPLGVRLRAASDRVVGPLSRLARDRTLRGEVEWIVAKCCARIPTQRYSDARALADDLRRLREGRPITAAPADSRYPLWFVLRRHRVALSVAGIAIVAVFAILAFVAAGERQRADEEARRRDELSQTLARVRTALVPITGRGRGDVVNDAEALPILESMHALNVALLGAAATETQQSALHLVRAYDRAKRYPEAESLYRAMLAEAESHPTRLGDQAFLRFMLGGNLRRQGSERIVEARALMLRAIGHWNGLADPPAIRCSGFAEMAFIAGLEGQASEREKWLADAIACFEAEASPGFMRTRECYGFMADHLREARDFASARAWYGRALDGLEATDASVQAWIDVWRAELLWIAREESRGGVAAFDREQAAELERLTDEVQRRDPTHPRLERWKAVEAHDQGSET